MILELKIRKQTWDWAERGANCRCVSLGFWFTGWSSYFPNHCVKVFNTRREASENANAQRLGHRDGFAPAVINPVRVIPDWRRGTVWHGFISEWVMPLDRASHLRPECTAAMHNLSRRIVEAGWKWGGDPCVDLQLKNFGGVTMRDRVERVVMLDWSEMKKGGA